MPLGLIVFFAPGIDGEFYKGSKWAEEGNGDFTGIKFDSIPVRGMQIAHPDAPVGETYAYPPIMYTGDLTATDPMSVSQPYPTAPDTNELVKEAFGMDGVFHTNGAPNALETTGTILPQRGISDGSTTLRDYADATIPPWRPVLPSIGEYGSGEYQAGMIVRHREAGPSDLEQSDMRSKYYICLQTYNPSSSSHPGSEPGVGVNWQLYWQECSNIWLRVQKTTSSDGTKSYLQFYQYIGFKDKPDINTPNADVPSFNYDGLGDWMLITPGDRYAMDATTRVQTSQYTRLNITDWDDELLVGIAAHSGTSNASLTGEFANLEIGLDTDPGIAGIEETINASDWEADNQGGADPNLPTEWTRYLASQYQVFFGPVDITEDFFLWGQNNGAYPANESWFYNTREFWSQGLHWNDDIAATAADLVNKSTGYDARTFDGMRQHERFAKTTQLIIDMASLQQYLTTRTFGDAKKRWDGASDSTGVNDSDSSNILSARFNGLILAERTNRYPWNPLVEIKQLNSNLDDSYPFSEQLTVLNIDNPYNTMLPNNTYAIQRYGTGQSLGQSGSSDAAYWSAVLNPYADTSDGGYGSNGTPIAPAYRPHQFHHGVLIQNGSDINWGFTGLSNPKFGTGKTTIATPNAMYVQGNFNTVKKSVTVREGASPEERLVPLAVMGDTITLLSNNFDWRSFQQANIRLNDNDKFNGGTLARNLSGRATNTTYNMAIVTNNQPTTKQRVAEGESSSFVNNLLFMERWKHNNTTSTMTYSGSLVVMDSCRFTQGYLLQLAKSTGRSPISTSLDSDGKRIPGWLVYSAPRRDLSFNTDLRSEAGTPPFSPVGFSSIGIGGWLRILK